MQEKPVITRSDQADSGKPGLSKEETVCRFLEISPRTLRNYRNRGLIPFVRFSRTCIRYDLDAVRRAVKRLSVSHTD